MNIVATDFSLKRRSLDIYVSGCKGPHCEGCHNPELWSFNQGELYTPNFFYKLSTKVQNFRTIIHNIMIFGGEPLDQKKEHLITMLSDLKILDLPVWLFTRYELQDIPDDIIGLCDYIKTGEYSTHKKCKNNICFGIELATANQKIHRTRDIRYKSSKMRINSAY
jgi:anaerobic ribonucleoside-triphosphate reductase activating protein